MVADTWESASTRHKRALLQALLEKAAERARAQRTPYPWQRPHQHPPDWDGLCSPACADLPPLHLGTHETWLLMGGRGTGKTDACALYVLDHVAGPPCDPRVRGGHRVAIVAPTIGDALESMVSGPSGLLAYDQRLRISGAANGSIVWWPTGARARLFGAHTTDDVNRLRAGGNTCLVVLEEAAAMRYLGAVLENSALGLRLGPRPHYVAATTPKVRPEIRALVADPTVHRTRGRTEDAHALDPAVRDSLEARFRGTRTGRQEMGGELLEEVEGAPWTRALIDDHRVRQAPPLRVVVTAVDPNAGGDDEAGIVTVGVGLTPEPDATGLTVPHLYVLDDASGHYRLPGDWARTAIHQHRRWRGHRIVAEVNQGGNMVPALIRQVDPSVDVSTVHATDGKLARMDPVVGLYQQGRVHHVGMFPTLEDQQTTWTPAAAWSPDRIDALVWAVTELALPRASRGGHVSAA